MSEPNPPSRKSLNVLSGDERSRRLREELARVGQSNEESGSTESAATSASGASPAGIALRDRVIAAIRTVYDPEIPVNIYDLGLIYDIDIRDDQSAHVRMTLTAPGCPVAGILPGQVQQAVAGVEGVSSASVELVWDPPWTKDRMSEEVRLILGI